MADEARWWSTPGLTEEDAVLMNDAVRSDDDVEYAREMLTRLGVDTGETDRERIIRELKDVALYSVSMSDGTHWYLDVEDAIAIVRGERDE